MMKDAINITWYLLYNLYRLMCNPYHFKRKQKLRPKVNNGNHTYNVSGSVKIKIPDELRVFTPPRTRSGVVSSNPNNWAREERELQDMQDTETRQQQICAQLDHVRDVYNRTQPNPYLQPGEPDEPNFEQSRRRADVLREPNILVPGDLPKGRQELEEGVECTDYRGRVYCKVNGKRVYRDPPKKQKTKPRMEDLIIEND